MGRRIALAAWLSLTAQPAVAQMTITLKPETIQEFRQYVEMVEIEHQKSIRGEKPFLWLDEDPRRRANAIRGEIEIYQVRGDVIPVSGGLVHDWIGATFVPEAGLEDTVALLQDFPRHKDIYPEVITATLLSKDGDVVRSMMRTQKKKVLTVVLEMELEAHYQKVEEQRYYVPSYSTRISEVKHAGESGEELFPDGQGTGFLWRLYSYWKLQQVAGGVYVELETISLTRDIPFGLGFVLKPFLKNVPRESLTEILQATRSALGR